MLRKTGKPAGYGQEEGEYPFYTSSIKLTKFCDEWDYEPDAITMATGGQAMVYYTDTRWSCSNDNYSFRTNQVTKYVYYYIFSILDYINKYGFKGSGLKHLQKPWLSSQILPIPPLSEQQAIADHIDTMVEKIDNEIKSLESLIQQVKDYKSSKIYEMVTGK